jgi:transposase-like protein
MSKSNRSYTNEFIREAIKLALDSPSITNTAKNLGIPIGTLHTWIRSAKKSSEQPIIS